MSDRYPHLASLVRRIVRESYGTQAAARLLPEAAWVYPPDAAVLDATASVLSEEEATAAVLGCPDRNLAPRMFEEGSPYAALLSFCGDVADGEHPEHFFRE